MPLGIRMKENYENRAKTYLMRRTPVIIRLDGRAFHTFTRGFHKPFDDVLVKIMQKTMQYLCENIQGCVLGYTQSDEITLVLQDYKELETQAWFDYNVQKMCSIAASMATMKFNQYFNKEIEELVAEADPVFHSSVYTKDYMMRLETYKNAAQKGAMFDARCFNIPKEEVTNCLYWRQLDAIRNSIQMVGQDNFSETQLRNKTCKDIIEMLWREERISWEALPTALKRGSCCIKSDLGWIIDTEVPEFKGEDRKYIEELI